MTSSAKLSITLKLGKSANINAFEPGVDDTNDQETDCHTAFKLTWLWYRHHQDIHKFTHQKKKFVFTQTGFAGIQHNGAKDGRFLP